MILKGQTAAVSFIHSMKETAIFKMKSLLYLQVPKAENDRSFLQFDKWKYEKKVSKVISQHGRNFLCAYDNSSTL
jgi:hypothetical protein